MLLLLPGFPFGEKEFLFIVLCFQGKQLHVCTVWTCTHRHVLIVRMWKSAGQVKTVEELPPISRIFQRCPPLFNSAITGESVSAVSLPVTLSVSVSGLCFLSLSSSP